MAYNPNAIFVSPTALDNYKNCPYKYLVVNRQKYKDEKINDNQVLGNSIHEVLQKYGEKIIIAYKDYEHDIANETPPLLLSNEYKVKFYTIIKLICDNYSQIFNRDIWRIVKVENWIDKIYMPNDIILTAKYDRLDYGSKSDVVDPKFDNVHGDRDPEFIVAYDYKTGKVNEGWLDKNFQFLFYSKWLFNAYPQVEDKRVKFISFKDGIFKPIEKQASIQNFGVVEDMIGKLTSERNYDPCQNNMCEWCNLKLAGLCPINGGVDRREKTVKPDNNIIAKASVIFNGVQADVELKERFNVEIFPGLTLDCGIKLIGQQSEIQQHFDNFVNKIKQRIKQIKGE